MSNYTLPVDATIHVATTAAAHTFRFFVQPGVTALVDGVSSGISAAQMRVGFVTSGVSDAVSSVTDHVIAAASGATAYVQSSTHAAASAALDKSVAAISGASNYIASVIIPDFSPTVRYAIAALSTLSAATVVYQITKPVTPEFDLSDANSEVASQDYHDCVSDTSESGSDVDASSDSHIESELDSDITDSEVMSHIDKDCFSDTPVSGSEMGTQSINYVESDDAYDETDSQSSDDYSDRLSVATHVGEECSQDKAEPCVEVTDVAPSNATNSFVEYAGAALFDAFIRVAEAFDYMVTTIVHMLSSISGYAMSLLSMNYMIDSQARANAFEVPEDFLQAKINRFYDRVLEYHAQGLTLEEIQSIFKESPMRGAITDEFIQCLIENYPGHEDQNRDHPQTGCADSASDRSQMAHS